jgi:hypothetical protein
MVAEADRLAAFYRHEAVKLLWRSAPAKANSNSRFEEIVGVHFLARK